MYTSCGAFNVSISTGDALARYVSIVSLQMPMPCQAFVEGEWRAQEKAHTLTHILLYSLTHTLR